MGSYTREQILSMPAGRPIKFRGKRVDNGEWVHGYLLRDLFWCTESGGNASFIFDVDKYNPGNNLDDIAVAVDPETVGQYTGLTDRKGKQIYEGDILELRTGHGRYGDRQVVGFEEGAFMYVQIGENIKCDDVIIGNIYTHPHLMEVSNT